MIWSELFIRKKGVLRALPPSFAGSLLPSCFSPSPSRSPSLSRRSRSRSLCVISIMEFRPSVRRPQTAICWLLRARIDRGAAVRCSFGRVKTENIASFSLVRPSVRPSVRLMDRSLNTLMMMTTASAAAIIIVIIITRTHGRSGDSLNGRGNEPHSSERYFTPLLNQSERGHRGGRGTGGG